jgi:hypothetical protein
MEFKVIFFIIIVIILLYILVKYMSSSSTVATGLVSGTTMQTIAAKNLATTTSGVKSSNFTYSVWFYIDDWNYNYGQPKVLFGRVGTATSGSNTVSSASKKLADSLGLGSYGLSSYGSNPCPLVTFGAVENNLSVALTVYSESTANSSSLTTDDSVDPTSAAIIHTCSVPNVPIQSWCNLLISVYGRTLDIYLDGKLVNTCVLPGTAKINSEANVYITPVGGFAGWTSKFKYYPNATDPQTAWNIYQEGYGASFLNNLFGSSFKVTFSTTDSAGNETSSYSI